MEIGDRAAGATVARQAAGSTVADSKRGLFLAAFGLGLGVLAFLIQAREHAGYLPTLPLGLLAAAIGIYSVTRPGSTGAMRWLSGVAAAAGGIVVCVVAVRFVLILILSLLWGPSGLNSRVPGGATAARAEASLVFTDAKGVQKVGSESYCSPDSFGSRRGSWTSDHLAYQFRTTASRDEVVAWYRAKLEPLGWDAGADRQGLTFFSREHDTARFDSFDIEGPNAQHVVTTTFVPAAPLGGCEISSNRQG